MAALIVWLLLVSFAAFGFYLGVRYERKRLDRAATRALDEIYGKVRL